MQPGMPKTGAVQIDHLGDVYGVVLAALVVAGGFFLVSGWYMRRKVAGSPGEK